MKPLRQKPLPGSLAWYEAEWRRSGFKGRAARGLAQLSYENSRIRTRLDLLERFQVSSILGEVGSEAREAADDMVEVDGTPHLRSCMLARGTRWVSGGPGKRCSCGAIPRGDGHEQG